jgi:hypothetical protein
MGFLRFFAAETNPQSSKPPAYTVNYAILHQEATMNHSLSPGIPLALTQCQTIVRAETEQQLLDAWQMPLQGTRTDPWEGSNVLFLNDYAGTVIVNRIMGIEVRKRRCLALARWRRRKLASTGAVHAT